MKKGIFIFLSVIGLCVIGYFAFHFYFEKERDLWSLVPADAFLVYESDKIIEDYFTIKSKLGVDSNKKLSTILGVIDSTFLDELQPNITGIVSVHSIAKNNLQQILYLNNKNKSFNFFLEKYKKNLPDSVGMTTLKRKYLNTEISEVGELSYVRVGEYIAVSTSSILIEDVVRLLNDDEKKSFADIHSQSIKANKLKSDEGNIYLNTKSLSKFLSIILSDIRQFDLALSTFFDITIDQNMLKFNGFTIADNNSWLSQINEQKPVATSIYQFVPNNTFSLMHVAADQLAGVMGMSRKSDESAELNRWLSDEIAIAKYYDANKAELFPIIIAKLSDFNEGLKFFNKKSELSKKDTVYYENYDDKKIAEIQINEFPKKLFGDEYQGFDYSYFTFIDKYVIIANRVDIVKLVLDAIANEQTWGKSLTKTEFLSSTLTESNLSYVIDLSFSKALIQQIFDAKWLEKYDVSFLNRVEMGAVQVSNIDGKYYTSASVKYGAKVKETKHEMLEAAATTYLESMAITKPYVMKNHLDPTRREIVVQDSSHFIYQINHKGEIVWKDSLGEKIVSKVHQIDYYKNKKLQYLFATNKQIHLIDRNGEYVTGYPIVTDYTIDHFQLIDYDHSKNYRYLTSDKQGRLRMYDKKRVNLEGWKPSMSQGQLINVPRHERIRGRDLILAVHKESIEVFTRRGEPYEGFPLSFDFEVSGDIHVEKGTDFGNTAVSVISRDGLLLRFNLLGKIIDRKQFYKPTLDTRFSLVEGVIKKDYVILRKNKFRVALLDKKENVILEKDYLSSDDKLAQYYDLGGENNMYVINDTSQGFSYVYDYQGTLTNDKPINSSAEIALLLNYQTRKIKIYSVYEDQVRVHIY